MEHGARGRQEEGQERGVGDRERVRGRGPEPLPAEAVAVRGRARVHLGGAPDLHVLALGVGEDGGVHEPEHVPLDGVAAGVRKVEDRADGRAPALEARERAEGDVPAALLLGRGVARDHGEGRGRRHEAEVVQRRAEGLREAQDAGEEDVGVRAEAVRLERAALGVDVEDPLAQRAVVRAALLEGEPPGRGRHALQRVPLGEEGEGLVGVGERDELAARGLAVDDLAAVPRPVRAVAHDKLVGEGAADGVVARRDGLGAVPLREQGLVALGRALELAAGAIAQAPHELGEAVDALELVVRVVHAHAVMMIIIFDLVGVIIIISMVGAHEADQDVAGVRAGRAGEGGHGVQGAPRRRAAQERSRGLLEPRAIERDVGEGRRLAGGAPGGDGVAPVGHDAAQDLRPLLGGLLLDATTTTASTTGRGGPLSLARRGFHIIIFSLFCLSHETTREACTHNYL